MSTFEISQTAKALKVIGGLNRLAGELQAEHRHDLAAFVRAMIHLDFGSLGSLFDLIQNHPTPQSAADSLTDA